MTTVKNMILVLAEVFADPLRFSEKFSRIDKELSDTDEDDAAKAEPPAVDGACDSPLASLCKGLSKAGQFAGELLLDLYGGEFDVNLKNLAGETFFSQLQVSAPARHWDPWGSSFAKSCVSQVQCRHLLLVTVVGHLP